MTGDLFGQGELEVRPGGFQSFAYEEPVRPARLSALRSDVTAEAVPLPLEGKYRVQWRACALVLCLARCRGGSATLEQLHVLMWALRDGNNAERLREAWSGFSDGISLRAWDENLDDTLRLAKAAGLVEQTGSGRQTLSETGTTLAAAIVSDDDILVEEKARLRQLGSISTAGMWKRLGTAPLRRTEGGS